MLPQAPQREAHAEPLVSVTLFTILNIILIFRKKIRKEGLSSEGKGGDEAGSVSRGFTIRGISPNLLSPPFLWQGTALIILFLVMGHNIKSFK